MAKYDKEARAFNLKKFNAKHRMFKVYLDKKEDAALIEHLDSHKNKSKAIRQLLNGTKIPVANITFDHDKLKELTDDIVRQIQNGEIIMVTESETQGEWIPIKMRPGTDEEYEEFSQYGDCPREDFRVFECPLPDDEQKVLVTTRWGDICTDIWHRDIDCCYFEDNCDDDDVVAWMPLPEPYDSEVHDD